MIIVISIDGGGGGSIPVLKGPVPAPHGRAHWSKGRVDTLLLLCNMVEERLEVKETGVRRPPAPSSASSEVPVGHLVSSSG